MYFNGPATNYWRIASNKGSSEARGPQTMPVADR